MLDFFEIVAAPPIVGPAVHHCAVEYEVPEDGRLPAGLDNAIPHGLRRAVPRRKIEYAAGRACAREALRTLTETEALTVDTGQHGQPLWPDGVAGSITHSAGMAWAAVASTSDLAAIGIDLEAIMDETLATEIGHTIMCGGEKDLPASAGVSPAQRLTLLLAAKESVFKCLYPQIRRILEFGDAEIIALDEPAGTFRWCFCGVREGETCASGGEGRYLIDTERIFTAVQIP